MNNASIVVVGLAEQHIPEQTSDLKRLLPLLRSLGVQHDLWGWDISRLCRVGEGLSRGGWAGKTRVFAAYALWFVRVFLRALFRSGRPLYFCLMFEGALPVVLAGLIRKAPIIFANMDNAPMNRNWSRPARRILEALERFVASRAVIHLLPSPFRWKNADGNLRFVENAPLRATYTTALQIAEERGYKKKGALTIYVNGWLSDLRGMGVLYAAIKRCTHPVRVIMAGQLDCDDARLLAESALCEYLGRLPHADALAEYARAHVVFTYYDPIYEIDRLAASSKWNECIMSQTPFIVNSEVATAQRFRDAGACLSTAYRDVEGLSALIDRLAGEGTELERVRTGISNLRADFWDTKMLAVLRDAGLDVVDTAPPVGPAVQAAANGR